jgi:hypothetical protein
VVVVSYTPKIENENGARPLALSVWRGEFPEPGHMAEKLSRPQGGSCHVIIIIIILTLQSMDALEN